MPTMLVNRNSFTADEVWDRFPGLAPDDFNALLSWFTVKHEGHTIKYAGHHRYTISEG